ncbi:MAG: aspartyl protease family protein [Acidimicrobiales bacterium]
MLRRVAPLLLLLVGVAVVLGTGASGAAALGAGAGALGSHHRTVHVEPLVNFALPPVTAGCGGAVSLGGGAERVPITVSTVAGQVAEAVNVCIEGKGPYPFVLDTGDGESLISAGLAARLHLAHDGAPSTYEGVGCTGTAQPVRARSWSVAGVALAPQDLTAATLPDFGIRGQPYGLLGSDVLSRFGAVRIDFTAQTLTLGGPQGPAATDQTPEVRGPTGPPPSAVLTEQEAGTTVPATVVLTPGDVALNVRLRFGRGPAHVFTVDTGSSQSVVAGDLARSAHLASTDLAQRQTTVCSTITAPLVRSGPWSIPGVTLYPQLLGTANFGTIAANGLAGLLGSDQLQRFGWVIFDYSGGRLVLG